MRRLELPGIVFSLVGRIFYLQGEGESKPEKRSKGGGKEDNAYARMGLYIEILNIVYCTLLGGWKDQGGCKFNDMGWQGVGIFIRLSFFSSEVISNSKMLKGDLFAHH